jgi:hypothetical protein
MLDGHGPQIHQFIQLCQKQNSSLPIHDISNQLELLLKGSEKFTLKIEFYALNESSKTLYEICLGCYQKDYDFLTSTPKITQL